jgi:hypothetical protein
MSRRLNVHFRPEPKYALAVSVSALAINLTHAEAFDRRC